MSLLGIIILIVVLVALFGGGGYYWRRRPLRVASFIPPNNPNVAKAGGLQSQGIKGEAVAIYRDPLITKDLKSSGFPEG